MGYILLGRNAHLSGEKVAVSAYANALDFGKLPYGNIGIIMVVYVDQRFFETYGGRVYTVEYMSFDFNENLQHIKRGVISKIRISDCKFIEHLVKTVYY